MKYFAAALFCILVLGISREKKKEKEDKGKELSELLSFIRHLKREIGVFVKPVGKAIENFEAKSPALSLLIVELKKGENIKKAYASVEKSFPLEEEIKASLQRVFTALSDSYLNEAKKALADFEEELSAYCGTLEKKRAEGVKIIDTVSATLCIAAIIAVI